jgi:serine/threonine protein kinase
MRSCSCGVWNFFVQAGAVEFNPESWGGVSAEAQECVARMLTVDPSRRPTAEQVLALPWFASGGASSSHSSGELSAAVAKLKAWRAQKRLKSGAKAVLAAVAFRSHANKDGAKARENGASP